MSEKDLRIDGKKITNSLKYYRPYVAKNKNWLFIYVFSFSLFIQ